MTTRSEGPDGGSAEDGAGANALQDGRADEAADHGAAPVDHEELGGGVLREGADLGEAHVVDQQAADGDFGADVGEDADGAGDEPGVMPDAVGLGEGFGEGAGAEVLGEVGHAGLGLELDERERDGEEEQHERDADVGQAHGGGLRGAVGLALDVRHGEKARGADDGNGVAQDEDGSEEGRDEGADGVEGLGEVEAAGGCLGRPDDGDVGIDGDLHDGHAGGEDDERAEEDGEEREVGGGDEAGGADGHDDEADDHGLLVAVLIDEGSAGVAEDEVGGEEGELHGEDFGVVEREDALEVRDDDVVEAGEEADHEEERGGDAHGARVGLHLRVGGEAGRTDVADGNGQERTPSCRGCALCSLQE